MIPPQADYRTLQGMAFLCWYNYDDSMDEIIRELAMAVTVLGSRITRSALTLASVLANVGRTGIQSELYASSPRQL